MRAWEKAVQELGKAIDDRSYHRQLFMLAFDVSTAVGHESIYTRLKQRCHVKL